MSGHRTDKVGAQVRAEIMDIIQRDLKDPRIGFVSITTVRMSPDLRSARVRVSVLGDTSQQKDSLSGLRSATGVIRHQLGRRLQNLKFSPELRFEIDPSIEYSVHISKRLREILPESAELAEQYPMKEDDPPTPTVPREGGGS
jgi:ribosome-binding factor A